jgi:hypothetical protein
MHRPSKGSEQRGNDGMSEKQVAKTDAEVEVEQDGPATPRPGDEGAYEDSWYQVLRRLAPKHDRPEEREA